MDSMVERFWAKVERTGPNECWLWKGCGSRNRRGEIYGHFRVNGRMTRATRVSYELHNGPVPAGMVVRHKCDNPPCVNPAHLEVGTQRDNVKDRYDRGRQNHVAGEKHGNAKLTEQNVRDIRSRAAAGANKHAMAREYGVSNYAIYHAIHGWKHVE